ncbi:MULTISPECIES: ABC transporter permease [Aneurinibacillus]|uniref:ABC transporter permease n=1 Tax=Aneurinibacillus thermoaerophilus TaxID=143495 RepID=A0A1G7XDR8_ANETH|nr:MULTISPECIES: ABC transporter permease [Aneurinibacillus]AMA73329.1 hypothetical protein ACH33_11000 [Aneurinibacillus sp. XH2]MED0680536.1 ABC transporter permease [Aneurinibacillus thermoaerophilus]MED0736235.1 ABC transporter permease [Aneurinibacillus thermoaerophilus]MED0758568.1 ABC transporter permease [Aneurinibacillus thermoaerophilus]MED0760462.1 ABC transporter permease [Aneurinibacillus thermoaerophilus]
MGILIWQELYKIWNNKIVWLMIGLFASIYLFTTHTYYTWHSMMAWDRIADFSYSSGSIFEGILILLALSTSFSQEYQLKTDSIILSSKYGRNKLVTAKILASLSFITVLVLGFWILNITFNILMVGDIGWNLPIQSLQKYSSSPYAISIWQYCMIQIATNWLGCVAFGLFVLWLSVINRSYLVVFFVAGVVFATPFFIRNISHFSIIWIIKNASMTEFMRVENIFDSQRTVNWSEITIPLPYPIFYAYILALTIIFVGAIYRCFKTRQVR